MDTLRCFGSNLLACLISVVFEPDCFFSFFSESFWSVAVLGGSSQLIPPPIASLISKIQIHIKLSTIKCDDKETKRQNFSVVITILRKQWISNC